MSGDTAAPRRVGLFGGSFDPPHLAHRALGDLALSHLGLDELRWLPAGQPWQKAARVLAARAHRLAMLQLLLAGEPRFVIDERELDRAGPTYTIDTVREYAAEHPGTELLLVIGQDQYGRFDTWREWRELLERVTLAVAGRDGNSPAAPRRWQPSHTASSRCRCRPCRFRPPRRAQPRRKVSGSMPWSDRRWRAILRTTVCIRKA